MAHTASTNSARVFASQLFLILLILLAVSIEHRVSAAAPENATVPVTLDAKLQRQRALDRLGVLDWHTHGRLGRGVKVAVLDSGFRGYRSHLGSALPAHVVVHSFRADGDLEAKDSQHGILCGEVVHAIAPDAELLFANWDPDRPDEFLEAVRWARHEGARVVSCSIIMPTWSDGEGRGDVHRELTRLLGEGGAAGDMLCFASAGNTAERHWCGPFKDDGRGWHEWAAGQSTNPIRPWGDERVSVEVCSREGSALTVEIEDAASGRNIGRGVTDSHTGTTALRFQPQDGRSYRLRVGREGKGPASFHAVVLGGYLEYSTRAGSIPFPGDGPEVVAVGAVDDRDARLSYSSCGPNSERPKPDFVAEVPFPSLWRSRPFSGTSAAAPQAAGLTALLWSRRPEWTAAKVRDALKNAAVDLGPKGHDCETGYGRVHLP